MSKLYVISAYWFVIFVSVIWLQYGLLCQIKLSLKTHFVLQFVILC